MNIVIRHRQEVVLGAGGHVQDLAPGHHVVIHINGVNGVRNQHGIVHIKQIQQVAQVALGAVGYKDFGHVQLHAVAGIVFLDSGTQEFIALLAGDIAVERLFLALLLNGFQHGVGHAFGQRQRYVANAQADDILIRVGFLVSSNLVRNGAEKIAFVQLGIMLVQFHLSLPLHFNMVVRNI